MWFQIGSTAAAIAAVAGIVGVFTGESAPEHKDVATSAFAAQAFQHRHAEPAMLRALGNARRYLLTNRLLDQSCLLARNGATVEPLGACAATFAPAKRIHGWRADEKRISFVDPLGAPVVEFAWNEETGMSSLSSSLAPEAGALALLPITTR